MQEEASSVQRRQCGSGQRRMPGRPTTTGQATGWRRPTSPWTSSWAKLVPQLAGDFCELYTLPKSSRFSLALHGERMASLMAKEGCHRMQHFLLLFQESGNPRYALTQADYETYAEMPAFSQMVAGLDGKELQRAMQVRSIRPVQPA